MGGGSIVAVAVAAAAIAALTASLRQVLAGSRVCTVRRHCVSASPALSTHLPQVHSRATSSVPSSYVRSSSLPTVTGGISFLPSTTVSSVKASRPYRQIYPSNCFAVTISRVHALEVCLSCLALLPSLSQPLPPPTSRANRSPACPAAIVSRRSYSPCPDHEKSQNTRGSAARRVPLDPVKTIELAPR